jgi:hypothetical protein
MMERKPWKLAACILGVAAIFATAVQAQEVTSNVVGYVKVDLVGGVNSLLSTPFNQVDGSANTVSNVIGDQLPAGSSVFTWDGGAYVPATNLPVVGWQPSDLSLARGVGFFVATDGDASLLLLGEVPEDDTTLNLAAGNTLTGNPVPVDMTLSTSGLAGAPAGSSLFFWDGAGYVPATNLPVVGWQPDAALPPGEGFFVALDAPYDWTEPAP